MSGKMRSVKCQAALYMGVALALSMLLNNTAAWKAWSLLGEEYIYLFTGIILFYLVDPYIGVYTVLATTASGALNLALKHLFNTPRPLNPLVKVEGPGFPSGHAQVSASFWSMLTLLRREACLAALSLVMVTGVSLSRLYLRAHYPIDVAGGVVIGLTVSVALNQAGTRLSLGKTMLATGTAVSALSLIALVLNPGDTTAQGLLGVGAATAISAVFIEESVKALRNSALRPRLEMLAASGVLTAVLYLAARTGGILKIPLYTAVGLVLYGTPLIYTGLHGKAEKSRRG